MLTSSACRNSYPREIARKSHYKFDQAAPIAKVGDLAAYDAIIIGVGTRFGRLPSQMANFLDQAGGLWARGALHGKVGAAFTSTATQHGGQETTLFSIITNLLHFGMVIVGLDYGHAGQVTLPGPEDRGDRKQAARLMVFTWQTVVTRKRHSGPSKRFDFATTNRWRCI
jgi:NAD(P)H:quinone oxidoreductase type IV